MSWTFITADGDLGGGGDSISLDVTGLQVGDVVVIFAGAESDYVTWNYAAAVSALGWNGSTWWPDVSWTFTYGGFDYRFSMRTLVFRCTSVTVPDPSITVVPIYTYNAAWGSTMVFRPSAANIGVVGAIDTSAPGSNSPNVATNPVDCDDSLLIVGCFDWAGNPFDYTYESKATPDSVGELNPNTIRPAKHGGFVWAKSVPTATGGASGSTAWSYNSTVFGGLEPEYRPWGFTLWIQNRPFGAGSGGWKVGFVPLSATIPSPP